MDINSLYMPYIDDIDGLDVGQYIDLSLDGVESDNDDITPTDPFASGRTFDPVSIMTGTLRGVCLVGGCVCFCLCVGLCLSLLLPRSHESLLTAAAGNGW